MVKLNSKQLRVLAHPLRSRLLSALRLDGPATATTLAAAMETNTGATSYHLRQLAAVGLVVEDPGPEPGHGRERWWRAAHHEHGWESKDVVDDPDDKAAAAWLTEFQMRQFTELIADWLRDHYSHPPAWRDAAEISDYGLTLPPDRLRALNDELHAVIDRYQAEATGDGEQVLVFVAGFPRLPR